MAVTVTERRTEVTNAESTTDWTGAGYGTTTVSAEHTNAVAASLASTTGQVYYTQPTGSVNLGTSPGTLVYVWSFNNALQDAWDASPPANALLLGDGTDRIGFDMAGADRRVFNHFVGPSGADINGWQCLVLDTGQASAMNSAGNTYVVAGSFAGLDFTAITQWGTSVDTNSKALGGGYNIAVDIIRYGNDGIRITGGGATTQGSFLEIAIEDRARGDDKAHGILRELGTGLYGCQGPLTFGNSGDTSTNYFDDDGVVLAFEDRNISDGKYYLNVEGNSTGTNSFILANATVSTGGPTVKMDMSGGNVNTITLDAVTFASLGGVILFSANADASGHTINNCTFEACGKITVGAVDFQNNIVSNTGATDNAVTNTGGADMRGCSISGFEGTADESALLYDVNADPDGELDNMSITKGTASTHAIEFGTSVPATMTLRGCAFSGYNAADTNTDSTFYFADTGGSITLNLIGCTGNLSYKTAGATITLVEDPSTVTVTAQTTGGTAIQSANVFLRTKTGGTGPFPENDTVAINNSGNVATVTLAAHAMATDDYVLIEGAGYDANNGVFQITYLTTSTFSYTMATSPGDGAVSGTIKCWFVFLKGLTDVNGEIDMSRVIPSNQDVEGWSAKASGSPYYKNGSISGTVAAAGDTDFSAVMALDE